MTLDPGSDSGTLDPHAGGLAVVDFGAFPGQSGAQVDVAGQAAIAAGSFVEAWMVATATADHSVDDHRVEHIGVIAGNVTPGVGFTIYATHRGAGNTLVYGKWTVGWSWR